MQHVRQRSAMGAMFLAIALAAVATPSAAHAQDGGVFDKLKLHVGLSFKMSAVELAGVDEPKKEEFDGRPVLGQLYPGYFGTTVFGTFGGFLDVRAYEMFGLEFGVYSEESNASGEINDLDITLTTKDTVISLHARVASPGMVKFIFGIGPEWVLPGEASVDHDQLLRNCCTASKGDGGTSLGVMLGAEIDATYVRIPIELRFRWTPMGDTYDDRLEGIGNNPIRHKNNWEWQGNVMVGIGYFHDILSFLEP